jgi:hypothetical protein
LQTLEAFRPLIDFQSHRGQAFRLQLYRSCSMSSSSTA